MGGELIALRLWSGLVVGDGTPWASESEEGASTGISIRGRQFSDDSFFKIEAESALFTASTALQFS